MYCYLYDKKTKKYLGKKRKQLDPIEKVYLMPANGTMIEPPKYDTEKECVAFIGSAWVKSENPLYVKEKLSEESEDGIISYHLVNGKLTKKSSATLKKEKDAIAQNEIRAAAYQTIAGYKDELILKILGNLNMIEDLSYITQLKEISENGAANLETLHGRSLQNSIII